MLAGVSSGKSPLTAEMYVEFRLRTLINKYKRRCVCYTRVALRAPAPHSLIKHTSVRHTPYPPVASSSPCR